MGPTCCNRSDRSWFSWTGPARKATQRGICPRYSKKGNGKRGWIRWRRCLPSPCISWVFCFMGPTQPVRYVSFPHDGEANVAVKTYNIGFCCLIGNSRNQSYIYIYIIFLIIIIFIILIMVLFDLLPHFSLDFLFFIFFFFLNDNRLNLLTYQWVNFFNKDFEHSSLFNLHKKKFILMPLTT